MHPIPSSQPCSASQHWSSLAQEGQLTKLSSGPLANSSLSHWGPAELATVWSLSLSGSSLMPISLLLQSVLSGRSDSPSLSHPPSHPPLQAQVHSFKLIGHGRGTPHGYSAKASQDGGIKNSPHATLPIHPTPSSSWYPFPYATHTLPSPHPGLSSFPGSKFYASFLPATTQTIIQVPAGR